MSNRAAVIMKSYWNIGHTVWFLRQGELTNQWRLLLGVLGCLINLADFDKIVFYWGWKNAIFKLI